MLHVSTHNPISRLISRIPFLSIGLASRFSTLCYASSLSVNTYIYLTALRSYKKKKSENLDLLSLPFNLKHLMRTQNKIPFPQEKEEKWNACSGTFKDEQRNTRYQYLKIQSYTHYKELIYQTKEVWLPIKKNGISNILEKHIRLGFKRLKQLALNRTWKKDCKTQQKFCSSQWQIPTTCDH